VANTPFIGGALADFSHTETLSSIGVTNAFGNPINNFQITASSGTHYDANGVQLASAVPEPSSIILCAVGLSLMGWALRTPPPAAKRPPFLNLPPSPCSASAYAA
jgi:hypothetical protein